MKIGLFGVDPKYHNLALMKISAWHKSFGDRTELYNALMKETYDRVYVSKIFSKRSNKEGYIPENSIIGGSGYSLKTVLPYDMEHIMPDYSLYNLDYSLGFTSRGCIRNCSFCIVRQLPAEVVSGIVVFVL
jgi:tRNA A37 methylthiotransferase MiaB